MEEHISDVRVEGFEPPSPVVGASGVEPVPPSAAQLPPALFADPLTKPQAGYVYMFLL